jgi:hypothetical protein
MVSPQASSESENLEPERPSATLYIDTLWLTEQHAVRWRKVGKRTHVKGHLSSLNSELCCLPVCLPPKARGPDLGRPGPHRQASAIMEAALACSASLHLHCLTQHKTGNLFVITQLKDLVNRQLKTTLWLYKYQAMGGSTAVKTWPTISKTLSPSVSWFEMEVLFIFCLPMDDFDILLYQLFLLSTGEAGRGGLCETNLRGPFFTRWVKREIVSDGTGYSRTEYSPKRHIQSERGLSGDLMRAPKQYTAFFLYPSQGQKQSCRESVFRCYHYSWHCGIFVGRLL